MRHIFRYILQQDSDTDRQVPVKNQRQVETGRDSRNGLVADGVSASTYVREGYGVVDIIINHLDTPFFGLSPFSHAAPSILNGGALTPHPPRFCF